MTWIVVPLSFALGVLAARQWAGLRGPQFQPYSLRWNTEIDLFERVYR